MMIIEAEEAIKKEVATILKASGLKDGDLLDDDQFKSLTTNEVTFWYQEITRAEAVQRPINITWDLVSLGVIGRADNQTAVRNAYVIINVYLKKKVKNQDAITLLSKINKEFNSHGWSFEKAAYDTVSHTADSKQLRFEAARKI